LVGAEVTNDIGIEASVALKPRPKISAGVELAEQLE
jgi:hypothetical protein